MKKVKNLCPRRRKRTAAPTISINASRRYFSYQTTGPWTTFKKTCSRPNAITSDTTLWPSPPPASGTPTGALRAIRDPSRTRCRLSHKSPGWLCSRCPSQKTWLLSITTYRAKPPGIGRSWPFTKKPVPYVRGRYRRQKRRLHIPTTKRVTGK